VPLCEELGGGGRGGEYLRLAEGGFWEDLGEVIRKHTLDKRGFGPELSFSLCVP